MAKRNIESQNFEFHNSSLLDILSWRASHQSHKISYTFLNDSKGAELSVTYAELDSHARTIAAFLQKMNLRGERALLLYPPGFDYIAGFLGCLYAGVIAVPAYPPNPRRLARTLPRLEVIVKDSQAKVALTINSIRSSIKLFTKSSQVYNSLEKIPLLRKVMDRVSPADLKVSGLSHFNALEWIATDEIESDIAGKWENPNVGRDDLAFIQYTSGSTGEPKGVMLTHGNLLYNLKLMADAFMIPGCEGVIWLPMYHDMGLIGGVLQPIYYGVTCHLMSPLTFLQWPLRWLKAIAEIKDTPVVSGGPNFAYDLCIRKVTPDLLETLDLSNWKVAFSGAEPVRAETIEKFTEKFKPCGFRREAFYPCYGLAEATLFVSGGKVEDVPQVRSFEKDALKEKRVQVNSGKNHNTLVGCGKNLGEQQILVVHPDSKTVCQPDEIGEIWVKGGSIAKGYWQKPEKSREIFQAYTSDTGEGPFLRTGDLGFFYGDQLFISGRAKDLIIIRGRNHYPQDIEFTVENSHPALRPGCVAAFSMEVDNEEQLVIVQEIRPGNNHNLDEILSTILQNVVETHELHPYAIVLIKARTIPKTSSGKIQRWAAREAFVKGDLEIVTEMKFEDAAQDDLSEKQNISYEEPDQWSNIRNNPGIEVLEKWLAAVIAGLIKRDPGSISGNKSLPGFGLDSLMMVELKNEIEEKAGIDFPLNDLFERLTISQLAEKILGKMADENARRQAAIAPEADQKDEYPLSYGQRSLWFIHQLAPRSAAYNEYLSVKILSGLDVETLKKSFQILIDRHPSLRTTYPSKENEPCQRVRGRIMAPFEVVERLNRTEEQFREEMISEIHRPFSLETGPVLRITLYHLQAEEYVLLIVFHHIAIDLWSILVLLDELNAIYPAVLANEVVPSASAKFNYSDFVRWQADYASGTAGRNDFNFWKEKLPSYPPVLNLPTDKPRPAVQSYDGSSFSFSINNRISQKLKKLAIRQETTLYSVLLAAFQIFLYHYTGQNEILIGSPASGRTQSEFDRIIGYFVNTIVIRSDYFSGNPAFRKYLEKTSQSIRDALSHQDYPFPLLVEKLQPNRDMSRSPFFDVMFVLEKPHLLSDKNLAAFVLGEIGARTHMAGLDLESYPLEQKISQFDLTLMMVQSDGAISASFQYNTDLFESSTIARMAEHFKNLLESIVNAPDEKIDRLILLSGEERQKIESVWSQGSSGQLSQSCIHKIFEEQAKLTPDNIALLFEQQELTYRELNNQANRIAMTLRKHGIRPEMRIGVYTHRSPDMIAAILAIFKAGGVYVPLEPAYPEDRLKYMIEDAGISVIITQRSLQNIQSYESQMIFIDEEISSSVHQQYDNPEINIYPENLAYAIYTSGSTGLPKGVLVSHRAIANHCLKMKDYYQYSAEDRMLQFASLNFDASLEQILTPLISGASVLLRDDEIWPVSNVYQKIVQSGLTIINVPPAYWQQLTEAWAQEWERLPSNPLRMVIIGGDVMPMETLALWQKVTNSSIRLINAYGPTEATITSLAFDVPQGFGQSALRPRIPIGRPCPDRKVFILNKAGEAVPTGVFGELHIGGICLARGYLNRPDLTAEKFIPNPFCDTPGQLLYKTGDMARFLPDGNVEFGGRIDQQVKIRGIRIEPGEVEFALRKYPRIRDAAVTVWEEMPGDFRLAAYVVNKNSKSVDMADVRSFLKKKLPEYMIPADFMILDKLPLNPAGKVDRKALPKPEKDMSDLAKSYVPPRNPMEEKIAGIVSDVLGIERVGLHHNFFELGGHSLLATKVISRIREHFQVELPLVKLFEEPTVAGLSNAITCSQAEMLGSEKAIQILMEIENLSDEEVRKLLGN